MMPLLAGLLGAFTGPLAKYLAITAGALLAITGAHLTIENWKGNLRAEGTRACDARWEQTIREEERKAASHDANAARSLLESERRTTGELHDEIAFMQTELDRLRDDSAGGDERCLSDGVLKSLGKQRTTKREPGARQKAAPPEPAGLLQEVFPQAYGTAKKP